MPGETLTTFTGSILDLDNPRPDQIDVAHLAMGLSRVNRFTGQTPQSYTVAQHSIAVADQVSRIVFSKVGFSAYTPAITLAALLHDAAEAYLSDLPGPVKRRIGPGFKELETAVARAIHQHFGIELPPPGNELAFWIKEADQLELLREQSWREGRTTMLVMPEHAAKSEWRRRVQIAWDSHRGIKS